MTSAAKEPLGLAVLISGGGTNLQSIITHIADGLLDAKLVAVISDRRDAYGLERARRAGVATAVLGAGDFPDRQSYDTALAGLVTSYSAELVVLAGFMRVLTEPVVEAFAGRLLNIHPSLLPRYRGLHTYRRVLDAGDPVHGTSVHFVTIDLDAGPVIAQVRVPVQRDDDETSLSARVQAAEHRLYPLVIQWYAQDRLHLHEGEVWLDGRRLRRPRLYDYEGNILIEANNAEKA